MANTIQDKLAYLEQTKGLIKEAIVAKGGTVSDEDTFRSYANKIKAIETGGGGSIAGAPSGMKFVNSTFTTVPLEIIPYIEQQTDLSGMFENCENLTTVPQFAAKKATSMQKMFYNCQKLQTVSQISTPLVTTMNNMFYYCSKLETIPLLDTSSVTDMGGMFISCTSLKTIPLLDTSSVTMMDNMFNTCSSLETIPLLDTSSVTDMHNMFVGCSKLQTVQLSDTSLVNNTSWMFYECSSLTNLEGFTGLKVNLDLRYSPLLTVDSVVNVITAAADMTSELKTLILHKDVFNKLSEEQIETAIAKGWNIAY